MRKIAYGVTATLAAAVVAVELLHAPLMLVFALTSASTSSPPWRSFSP